MTGIDICVFQENINWDQVAAAGVAFCMIQISQGKGLQNLIDHEQSMAAQKAGVKIGYYHFAHPERNAAVEEALFFVSQIRRQDIPTADLIPALDVEQAYINGIEQKLSYNSLEQWIKDFCGVLAAHGFPKVMLYSNPGYLNANLPAGHSLGDMPLWLSEYAGHVSLLPSGWSSWTLWQNSGTGHVNGINGNVDTDQCNDISSLFLNQSS